MIISVVCLSILLARLTASFPLFEALHLKTVNSFFKARGPIQPPDTSIVIVTVDEQTFKSLPASWPYPGSYYAHLVRNLTRAGARVIVFDADFIETNAARPEEDFEFAEAIHESGRTILAGKIVYEMKQGGVMRGYLLKPNAWLEEVAHSWGLINSMEDSDGFWRRYLLFFEFGDRIYYPLALEALKFLENPTIPEEANKRGDEFIIGKYRIPKIGANAMMINYNGPAGESFRTFPLSSVLDDPSFDLRSGDTDHFDVLLHEGAFRDKIVFVGAVDRELWHIKYTPFYGYKGSHRKMADVEVHAHALSTIRREHFLRPPDAFVEFVLLSVLVILAAILVFNVRAWQSLTAGALLLVALHLGALALFLHRGLIMNLTMPFLGILFCYAGGMLLTVARDRREKHRIRKIFRQNVSPAVIEEMIGRAKLPEFSGESRELTVLFCGIRSFTALAEEGEPEKVVSKLADYFGQMVDIIFKHKGTVNKFIGEQIMAIFGAPLSFADHAEFACRAALEMAEKLRLLTKRAGDAGSRPYEAGIAVNTGQAIVGNLGPKQLFNYSVVGSESNLAAQLETANRLYGTDVIISENTYAHVQGKAKAREIDQVRVGNVSKPLRIYELRSMERLPTPEQELIIEAFAEGLRQYRNRHWGEALKTFRRILRDFPDDGPARLYTIRCLDFLEKPPPPDWDGIYDIK